VLKIDRSFVSGLGRDAEDDAIVSAVLSMGRALGVEGSSSYARRLRAVDDL
jgi:EAL domain-containing protein (putative c-di-GMP-specific phosphodiesterase class I)